MTQGSRRLGIYGEGLAARWYVEHGYRVVDRNWRGAVGEIDLVLRRGRTLVVCEVKTRSSLAFGSPAEAVTAAKRARLRRLTAQWLSEHDVHAMNVRFDVAAVMGGSVDVMMGAW